MPRGVRKVQSTEPTSVPLPPVTEMDRQIVANTLYHTTGRFMCGDVTLTFAIDGTLDEIQARVAYLETKGWRCTLAPDAEARERKDTNRDQFEQQEQGNPAPRRNGQRDYQPKDERLKLPFAVKGQFKGWYLIDIEREQPSLINWLAENCKFADIRKACDKIINTRREELPF